MKRKVEEVVEKKSKPKRESKKRKPEDIPRKPTKKPAIYNALEANDVAGFIPCEITELMTRGASYHEALARILEHHPQSQDLCRRVEKMIQMEKLDPIERKTLSKGLQKSPARFRRVWVLMIRAKNLPTGRSDYQRFIFSTSEKAKNAIVPFLQTFPPQIVGDMPSGSTEIDLSGVVREMHKWLKYRPVIHFDLRKDNKIFNMHIRIIRQCDPMIIDM
jgi:hypothetical protein